MVSIESSPEALPRLPRAERSGSAGWAGWLLSGLIFLGVLGWRLSQRLDRPAPLLWPTEVVSRLTLRDGRMFQSNAIAPYTGWMEDHYADVSLKSRSFVSNGVLSGVSEGWYTNGVLQTREHFVAGVSVGPMTRWHHNGVKSSEGIARAGKFEGNFRRWHENGVLAEEVTFQDSQPDGLSRAWFPSGCLKAEVALRVGQVVTQRFWKDGEMCGSAGVPGIF